MKQKIVQPYLFFGGRCDEAQEFYKRSIGATVQYLIRYKDSPQKAPPGQLPPGFEDKVMHSTVKIGQTELNMSDGNEVGPKFEGFSLSIEFPTEAETKEAFSALSDGGAVTMPLGKTFFSAAFGMLTDRFGVSWIVSISR